MIGLVFFLFACEKENLGIDRPQSITDKVINLPKSSRKLAFNLLSPSEKAQVWENRISLELKNDLTLTQDQKLILQKFRTISTPDLFDQKQTVEEERQNGDLLNAGLKLFSAEYLYKLLFTLDSLKENEADLIEKAVTPDCICNLSNGCFRVGGPTYIETGACEAKKACKTLTTGCGLFWQYSCNGDNCDFGGG